jgi:transmembrane sensor
MKTTIDQAFLFRYFAGQLTPFQVRMLDTWLTDPANTELFYEVLATWEAQNPQFLADSRAAHDRHKARFARIAAEPEPGRVLSGRFWGGWGSRSWLVAASVGLLLLAGGYVFRDPLLTRTYQTPYGQTQPLTLPDGSRVVLNANSTLRVPRFGFGAATRAVDLDGEATFSVTHQPDHQSFVVRTRQHLDVVVLGTEFSVYARERGARVALETGKVQLRFTQERTRKDLYLKPGDVASFSRTNVPTIRAVAEPQQLAAWRDNRFVFETTPLSELAHLLHENFGLDVVIPDAALSRQTVSGSFTAQSAEEMLQILSETSGLQFQKTSNQIVISPPR